MINIYIIIIGTVK